MEKIIYSMKAKKKELVTIMSYLHRWRQIGFRVHPNLLQQNVILFIIIEINVFYIESRCQIFFSIYYVFISSNIEFPNNCKKFNFVTDHLIIIFFAKFQLLNYFSNKLELTALIS